MEFKLADQLKIKIYNHLKTIPGISNLSSIIDSNFECTSKKEAFNCINIVNTKDGLILKIGIKILINVPTKTILNSIYEDINWLFQAQKLNLKDIDIIIQGVK